MNPNSGYRMADGVAIRPERFGGLVYNYQSRRLYFLHTHELTEFVSGLNGERPIAEAVAVFRKRQGLPVEVEQAMLKSLSALETLGLIVPKAP